MTAVLEANTVADLQLEYAWEGPALHIRHQNRTNGRRVMFLSDHGGPDVFESWTQSRFGGHGLWGCVELAQKGYEVIMPRLSRLHHSRLTKNVMSDFEPAWKIARGLGAEDIVYCVHNLLWWTPLLHTFGGVKAKLVTMLFAKEPLPMAKRHAGILGMTRVATEHGRKLNPKALHAHIPWAIEMTNHHHRLLPYDPRWGLSTGVTNRDFEGIAKAYRGFDAALKICARGAEMPPMPANVEVVTKFVSPEHLVEELYRYAAYVLVYLRPDPNEREALGCKNLLESMALGRPVIKSRGGSMDGDIDVEKEGFGVYVESGDFEGLHRAVKAMVAEPERAAEMGRRGRALCERSYTMERFGEDLHGFFERL